MAAKKPDEHFAEYSDNTRIKHEILSAYLKAYLTALSHTVKFVHYIDGFAGRGYYEESNPGSPLRALELLRQSPLQYCASFVEADEPCAQNLREVVSALPAAAHQIESPLVLTGEFSSHLDQVLARPVLGRFPRRATFAFVDPCRVKGVHARDLGRILAHPYGECLVFWNYDGMNRWLGAVKSGDLSGSLLSDMFGDTDLVRHALDLHQNSPSPALKEQALLALQLEALRAKAGATYLLPFRFNARDADRTSHYLIHCSRHSLGFKLMKEVMASRSSSSEPGKFEYLGERELGRQSDLFRPASDDVARDEIINDLRLGTRPVTKFVDDWVRRRSDFLAASDYRRLILAMEEAGLVEVLSSERGERKPREKRMRQGKPTLGEALWLRLPPGE